MTPTATLEHDLRQLNADIKKAEGEATEKHAAADKLVEDLRAAGKEPLKDKDAFDQVDAAYKEADSLKQGIVEMRSRADRAMEILGAKTPRRNETPGGAVVDTRRSAVSLLMESDEYQRLADAAAFTGNAHIEIPGVEVLTRDEIVSLLRGGGGGFRADAGQDAVSPLVPSQRQFFPPVLIPVRSPRILDLVTVTTTDSNLIEYIAMLAREDAAAPKAYGTAYDQANYTFEQREAPVRDIGQWIPAHRSQLEDQGQLEGLYENLLESGVNIALENQVLAGDGTGQNLEGILETDGLNAIQRDTTNERRVEALHRGITAIRLSLFDEPDGIVLHPTDYEETLFEKTGDDVGGYVWQGGMASLTGPTPASLWGKPVVATAAEPEGKGLVGNFKRGATVFMRAGVRTRVSDSHADFFTRRMVAILAETRAALAVYLPIAFAEVDDI